jgi:NTP pyrophosphatase (non-canonical NTP hydrolase)
MIPMIPKFAPLAYQDIFAERERQEKLKAEGKFLFTCADEVDETVKLAVLAEEFGEVAKEVTELTIMYDKIIQGKITEDDINTQEIQNYKKLRTELIQVAAVCVAWVEAIDREQT